MTTTERIAILCTAVFALVCAALLLFSTTDITVTSEGVTAYAAPADGATIAERLDALLGKTDDEPAVDTAGRLNLNTATVEELTTLPGIGETLAARIVRYRTYNGDFTDVQQLADVTGIGDAKVEAVAALVYVE